MAIFKTAQLKYKDLQRLRELMIEEVKEFTPFISVEFYRLVEMRLQTLLMTDNIDVTEIIKNIKDKKNV